MNSSAILLRVSTSNDRDLRPLILERTNRGMVSKIVVTHYDQLCQFAFDLIQYMFSLHTTKLVGHISRRCPNRGAGDNNNAKSTTVDPSVLQNLLQQLTIQNQPTTVNSGYNEPVYTENLIY